LVFFAQIEMKTAARGMPSGDLPPSLGGDSGYQEKEVFVF
jgi:hypothetical protein